MANMLLSDYLLLLQEKSFAEFFAGIGLVRMGLEHQGWSIAFANDISEQKYAMYQGHFKNSNTYFLPGDVHAISARCVPHVTLATASFPCNDLSLAGSRKGLEGKHSSAVWGFIRILSQMAEHKPPLILLENVPGFLTSNNGEDFRQVLLSLNELGYSVDAFILDAAHFVPQSRQRLFVVGHLEPLFSLSDLKASLWMSDTRPKMLVHFMLEHPEIRWRLRSLPSQPDNVSTLASVLEDLPESAPEWWSHKRASYLLTQMSSRHQEIANQMIVREQWTYGTVFRRMRNGKSTAELRTDGIAGCLRTPRGGSAKQILFKAGYGKYFARLLTSREAARLMGADDYQITVSSDQALFGFGDAVCVPVIEWIACNYLNPIINEVMQAKFADYSLQEIFV